MIVKNKNSRFIWPTAVSIIGIAIAVALGSWQLQRMAWKDALQADIDARSTGDAVALLSPMQIDRWLIRDGGEYTKVRVSGTFDHGKERYLYASHPRFGPGHHIYTPLRVGDNRVVWINRGYVPERMKAASSRASSLVSGEIDVVGLVRRQAQQTGFDLDNDAGKNAWYWRDIKAMQKSAFSSTEVRSFPFSLDVMAASESASADASDVWPKGGVTIVKLVNRHLEYALTWFGLALTLLGVYVVWVVGQIRGSRPGGNQID